MAESQQTGDVPYPPQAAGTQSSQQQKAAEAWGQPPAYTQGQALPPIGRSAVPPSAAYTSPTYTTNTAAVVQPQQTRIPLQPQPTNNPTPTQLHQTEAADGPGSRKGWADGSARVCAALQIVCGTIMFIFHVVAIIIDSNLHEVGHGIWGGLFMLVTGIVGVVAANKKSTSAITGFMVLSIITAIGCLPLLIISAVGMSEDMRGYRDNFWGFYFKRKSVSDEARAAMNGILMMVSIIEAIIAITSSALCCRAVCCGTNRQNPAPNQVNVVYVHAVPQHVMGGYPGQVMMVPSGQHLFNPGANMAISHGQQVMYTHQMAQPTSVIRT